MKHRITTVLLILGSAAGSLTTAQEPQLPQGPCKLSKEDPFGTAQKCKAIAESGDADAMYQFGIMLLTFAPEPGRGSPEELAKWQPLGNRFSGTKWLNDAAEKGSKQAMELKCRIGSDPLAPRTLREEGQKWCERVGK